MHAQPDTMENKDNMIMKLIRRLNAAILNFVKGIKLRPVGATLLGGFAGLSLTTNIIPSAMSFTGIMDSFSARWGLGGYAVYSVMAWSVGGWAAQKTGSKKLGAIILGFVGLASGLLFTVAGIGTEMYTLLIGSGAAMLYGAVGGMIIGDALRNPPTDNDAKPITSDKVNKNNSHGHDNGNSHKADHVRLFRFFN